VLVDIHRGGIEAGRPIVCSADQGHQHRTSAGRQGMSVAARVDGDHFELPADAAERCVRCVPPTSSGSSRRSPRLQQQPGYEAMIKRMQRRERGQPVELGELRRPRG
jgi:hypothetical protein